VRRRERDAQRPRGQHHHRTCAAGTLLQIFGVAGESDTGIVDDGLVHGRRNQRVEFAGERGIDSPIEERQHVARIGGIGSSRDARCGEGLMRDGELTRDVGGAPQTLRGHVGA